MWTNRNELPYNGYICDLDFLKTIFWDENLSSNKPYFLIGIRDGMGSMSVVVDGYASIPAGKRNGFAKDRYYIGIDFENAITHSRNSLPSGIVKKFTNWHVSSRKSDEQRKSYA